MDEYCADLDTSVSPLRMRIVVFADGAGCSLGDAERSTTAVVLLAESLAQAGESLPRNVLFVCFAAEERGLGEDGIEEIRVEVLRETRTIMGVPARSVRDRVWVDGELVEDTEDWYAQDADGNVWYLGEATTDAAGNYCVNVRRDSLVEIHAELVFGNVRVSSQTVSVDTTLPAGTVVSCAVGGCTAPWKSTPMSTPSPTFSRNALNHSATASTNFCPSTYLIAFRSYPGARGPTLIALTPVSSLNVP